MENIIKEFSKSFARLKVRQSDGTYVETTKVGEKGVLYWVRTPSGQILKGLDHEGLNQILGVLDKLDKENRAVLHFAILDIIQAELAQVEVEVNLADKGKRYSVIYRNINTDRMVQTASDDVEELLMDTTTPGYVQPG